MCVLLEALRVRTPTVHIYKYSPFELLTCVEALKSPSIAQYESLYITSHKAPTLAGAFSWDGQLAASGSADTTIRVRKTQSSECFIRN